MYSWENHWRKKSFEPVLDAYGSKAFAAFGKWIEGKKVLEVGFGTGRFLKKISDEKKYSLIVGVENSVSALKSMKKYSDIHLVRADMFSLPFKDDTFDTVLNEGVIIYYKNYNEALREIIRVGKNVITCVTNFYNLPFTIYKKIRGGKFEYGWEKAFTGKELKDLYESLGMTGMELEGYYPAHSVKRICSFPFVILTYPLGLLIDLIAAVADKVTNNAFSRAFGFYICIRGYKKLSSKNDRTSRA